MKILVDMGGTHVRFAVEEGGAPSEIKKYKAADFKTFEQALEKYISECGLKQKFSLRIATAAHPDEKNVWRFVNRNKWEIDVSALGNVEIILNDFEAATWGLTGLQDQKTLSKGKENKNAARCLIGPGTGLGLGYLTLAGKTFHVQGTLGGHLSAAAITDEQSRVLKAVEKTKDRSGHVVYEDVVSGPGVFNIYRALCNLSDEQQSAQTVEELFDHLTSPAARDALRLFHEFFALFAATVTVSGNSYGGLYLMGGVLDRLIEKSMFDLAHFQKFFTGGFVPSVKKSLDETPIIHVTDPYLALRGLVKASS